ncbi:MAG: hypothetical protein KBC84_00195 [Proteobacteria bacterium]|nr:hypothetical protein [Pseudomonadota bacterium]
MSNSATSRFHKLLSKHSFIVTACLIFFSNIWRATELLEYDFVRAEDLTHLFKEAIERGFSSVFYPIIGHYQTIPRLVIFLITSISIKYTPQLIIISALLISSFCLSIFTRSSFRWIIKSDLMRVFLCLAFSYSKGSHDTIFSLVSLVYLFICTEAFLLLEKDESEHWQCSFKKTCFLILLFLSAANSIILLPFIIYLYHETKNKNYLILIFALIATTLLNVIATTNDAISNPKSFDILLLITDYFTVYAFKFLINPAFGVFSYNIFNLISFKTLESIFLACDIAFFTALLIMRQKKLMILTFLMLCLNLNVVLQELVRPYSREMLFSPIEIRYSFSYAIFSIIFLCHIYSSTFQYLKINFTRWILLIWIIQCGINGGLFLECLTDEDVVGYWDRVTNKIGHYQSLRDRGELEKDGIVKIPKTPHSFINVYMQPLEIIIKAKD